MINTHVEETENQLNTINQKVHHKPPCHTASLKKAFPKANTVWEYLLDFGRKVVPEGRGIHIKMMCGATYVKRMYSVIKYFFPSSVEFSIFHLQLVSFIVSNTITMGKYFPNIGKSFYISFN